MGWGLFIMEKTPYRRRAAAEIRSDQIYVARKQGTSYQIFHYSMKEGKMQPEKSREMGKLRLAHLPVC